jgi:uncharacterized protein YkwD
MKLKILFSILGLLFLIPSLVFAYPDVLTDYDYKTAVDYISEEGIVSGYPDGTYRPGSKINRAEFTKIVVGAGLNYDPGQDPSGYDIYALAGLSFSDIEDGAWYIPYLRKAVQNGIIDGYPDGTFKPAANINLVEAAKILVKTLNVETEEPQGSEWYSEYIETLDNLKYLPPSFGYLAQVVTRGEMAEMVWRILTKNHNQEFVTVSKLENPCYPLGDDVPANVDMQLVRATWLQWYNDARAAEGITPLTYNSQLARTANVWSQEAVRRGEITHKRDPGDSYYDYWKITQWFKDLGLEFKNVNRITFTENIAWEYYNCSESQPDCTDHMIPQARKAFDFYMSEKGKAYTAHYDSIMQPLFKEIGLGIAVDRSANRYYLTVHYGTEITSNPWPICE